jgi:hypothetical protein
MERRRKLTDPNNEFNCVVPELRRSSSMSDARALLNELARQASENKNMPLRRSNSSSDLGAFLDEPTGDGVLQDTAWLIEGQRPDVSLSAPTGGASQETAKVDATTSIPNTSADADAVADVSPVAQEIETQPQQSPVEKIETKKVDIEMKKVE